MIETLEAANATEDPARRDELLTYVFVGGGYAGLEALAELQDFAADAMESYPRARLHGMRWVLVEAADRVLPEIDAGLAEYALRELRGRGIDIRLGTTLEEVERRHAPGSRPARRCRPAPSSGPPGWRRTRACASSRVPLDERGRVPVDELPAGAGHGLGLGDRRLRRGPRPARRHLPADRPARGSPGPGRGAQHRRRARRRRRRSRFEYRGNAAFVNLGRYKAVGRIGGRTFRGFPAWWMARTYHMSQIPGAARKARAVIDWTASLPFRRDLSEVGSIGHPRPLERDNGAMGFEYLVIAFFFGLATAIIGRAKGSSFWLWLLIGTVLPLLGLIAVILYRSEKDEPERQCPTCGKAVKLYVQVCPRCGTDLYLPDPAEVRHPGVEPEPREPPDRAGVPAPDCLDHAAVAKLEAADPVPGDLLAATVASIAYSTKTTSAARRPVPHLERDVRHQGLDPPDVVGLLVAADRPLHRRSGRSSASGCDRSRTSRAGRRRSSARFPRTPG